MSLREKRRRKRRTHKRRSDRAHCVAWLDHYSPSTTMSNKLSSHAKKTRTHNRSHGWIQCQVEQVQLQCKTEQEQEADEDEDNEEEEQQQDCGRSFVASLKNRELGRLSRNYQGRPGVKFGGLVPATDKGVSRIWVCRLWGEMGGHSDKRVDQVQGRQQRRQ